MMEYDDDPVWLKHCVRVLWCVSEWHPQRSLKLFFRVVESVHSAFCMHMIYTYLITDFGQASRLLEVIWLVVC